MVDRLILKSHRIIGGLFEPIIKEYPPITQTYQEFDPNYYTIENIKKRFEERKERDDKYEEKYNNIVNEIEEALKKRGLSQPYDIDSLTIYFWDRVISKDALIDIQYNKQIEKQRKIDKENEIKMLKELEIDRILELNLIKEFEAKNKIYNYEDDNSENYEENDENDNNVDDYLDNDIDYNYKKKWDLE